MGHIQTWIQLGKSIPLNCEWLGVQSLRLAKTVKCRVYLRLYRFCLFWNYGCYWWSSGALPFQWLVLGTMTGSNAFAAIGYALLHREKSGKGQFLDVSLIDSYKHCHEVNIEVMS